jgi:hypothetical protein
VLGFLQYSHSQLDLVPYTQSFGIDVLINLLLQDETQSQGKGPTPHTHDTPVHKTQQENDKNTEYFLLFCGPQH